MRRLTGAVVLKLFLKLLVIFAFLFISACNEYHSNQDIEIKEDGLIYKAGQNDPFTGRVVDTLNSNIIEYDVVKGLKNGEFRVSSVEGIPSVVGKVKDNRNIGKWNYYYPNGRLESTGNFKYDMPHGKWIWYYSNGNLKEKGTFLNGLKTGDWYQYTNNEKIISILTYDKGQLLNEVKFSLTKNV